MTRLSKLRSILFAHKLTSSISDNGLNLTRVDVLLTQARLGYETMLSQTSGERVDQRRSAMKGQVTYRQGVVAPAAVVLVLDINPNRQYHQAVLQQINHIINHTVTSCDQLGLECVILYPNQGETQEYICEGIGQTIKFLNKLIKSSNFQPSAFSLQLLYNEYYNHHAIVLSDWHTRDPESDAQQTNNQLATGQMIGYTRDYPSPIVHRGTTPDGLIQLKR